MRTVLREVLALLSERWESLIRRFWKGVAITEGCWEWQRYCCPSTGYGRLNNEKGAKEGAHRVSWRIHNGEIPVGLYVCHTCDNRKCVNPSHLFLGTAEDNNRDMRAKGRGVNPPRVYDGTAMSADERRSRNRERMGRAKTHCKRGHELPPYRPGTTRKCMHEDCRAARRYTALGGRAVG